MSHFFSLTPFLINTFSLACLLPGPNHQIIICICLLVCLFVCCLEDLPPENFGLCILIRTGCAQTSRTAVTPNHSSAALSEYDLISWVMCCPFSRFFPRGFDGNTSSSGFLRERPQEVKLSSSGMSGNVHVSPSCFVSSWSGGELLVWKSFCRDAGITVEEVALSPAEWTWHLC